ncbi:MAG: hypothetical protein CMC82_09645 [Flavobacteriaceae bacterium]|nr:hypothetical protein [Flavobacteriaceae bacterium]|tara:strand:- start:2755 stop:2973 length:219 start_codon:yes stop_codon:yes gene_type:complete
MNKRNLFRGLRAMVYAVLLAFTGPTVLTSAFKNQEHAMYIPVLGIAILMCAASIAIGFWGIQLLVKGLFGEE